MRKELTPEMFAGNFIREAATRVLPHPTRKSGHKVRYVTLRCMHCEAEFEVQMYNAIRTQQKCCSGTCYKQMVSMVPGGSEQHPLYSRWLAMKQRCNNSTSSNYKNYGGRGIYIAPELAVFVDYVRIVESLPNCPSEYTQDTQLDRVDNNGPYTADNLRWVTRNTQVANQRKQTTSANKYRGVLYSKTHNKWVARVTLDGKNYCSSTHHTEKEALEARNAAILRYGLPHPIQVWQE